MKRRTKIQYVIKWTAKRTGVTGYGTGKFTLEQAQRSADTLNKNNNMTIHTVVPYTKKLKDKLKRNNRK